MHYLSGWGGGCWTCIQCHVYISQCWTSAAGLQVVACVVLELYTFMQVHAEANMQELVRLLKSDVAYTSLDGQQSLRAYNVDEAICQNRFHAKWVQDGEPGHYPSTRLHHT